MAKHIYDKSSPHEAGQSLVSVMVGIAIMGIIMAGFLSMLSAQQNETRALTEKFAALSLKSLLSATLADGSVCLYQLNNPAVLTFDSSSPAALNSASISVNEIYASYNSATATVGPAVATVNTPASPDSNTLWISSIQLRNFQGSGTSYTANWTINFDSNKTLRPLKPITIPVTLVVDNTTPSATRITGCMNAGGAPPATCTVAHSNSNSWGGGTQTATCPAGLTLTGGSCDMNRGGDGREIAPRTCAPSGNSMTCAEGNSGTCIAHAICCP